MYENIDFEIELMTCFRSTGLRESGVRNIIGKTPSG